MTKYEVLKLNRELFQLVLNTGVNINDVRYVEIYERYSLMRSQGEKMGYIIMKLADVYSLTPRYIEKIISRMKAEIKI